MYSTGKAGSRFGAPKPLDYGHGRLSNILVASKSAFLISLDYPPGYGSEAKSPNNLIGTAKGKLPTHMTRIMLDI